MDPIELVTPAIGLMFWTCVVFSLLLILLKKFAWKPILSAVDARNSGIEEALALAKKTKDEMANLQADNKMLLQEARSERDQMLKEAREMKNAIISEAKNTAKEEADKMIASAKAVIENDAKSGSVVVLDAQSGEILALANWPSYNPNNRKTYRPSIARNLAVVDIFEPGSTLKPFNAAAAIEAGYVTPRTSINIGNGRLRVGNNEITDTHPKKTNLTVSEIIKVSSNVGSAQIALKMPSEELWRMFSLVGFGKSPESGFPGEAKGRLRKFSTWKTIEKATMSFGHGISVSLIQLARAYTIFTTGGRLLPITFVKRDALPKGRMVMSLQTSKALGKMLEEVIEDGGTGTKARVLGYRVAGKTGTAHKLLDGAYSKHSYYSSFVGFAPASKPKLIVAVVIDDPRGGHYFGGTVAAPVFSQIIGNSLRLLDVPGDKKEKTLTADRQSPSAEG